METRSPGQLPAVTPDPEAGADRLETLEQAFTSERPIVMMTAAELDARLLKERERGREEGRVDNHRALLAVVFSALADAVDSSTPVGMPSNYTVATMVEVAVGRNEVAACETLTGCVDPEQMARWIDPEVTLDRVDRIIRRVLSSYDDGINRVMAALDREAGALGHAAERVRDQLSSVQSEVEDALSEAESFLSQAEDIEAISNEFTESIPDFGDLRNEIVEALRKDLNLN